MNIDLETSCISNFIVNGCWDFSKLGFLFGDNLDFIIPRLGTIASNVVNRWMWFPKSQSTNISSMVYKCLNEKIDSDNGWKGWKIIWTLKVVPRAKHFLWLLFKGRISTSEFLYSLNLGPRNLCTLCGLEYETIDHLIGSCQYAQTV